MGLTPYEERLVALLERAANHSTAHLRKITMSEVWLDDVRAALDEGPGSEDRVVLEHGIIVAAPTELIEGAPERLHLVRGCQMCETMWQAERALSQHPGTAIGPPHRASPNCLSGKRPHCTCDVCF